jgi:GLPGLI family protein
MKKILIVLFLGVSAFANAQNINGKIVFERKSDWIKIQSKATYLTKEEKDRMAQTWKNDSEFKQKMLLFFDQNQSHYTYENQQGESEDGTYTWRNDEYQLTRDLAKGKVLEIHEMLGKTYILDDSLYAPKWKIHNEIKEVAGYICMKASTRDTVRSQDIVAWFATDIPVSIGPERIAGLPGMILELNIDNDAVVIVATSIKLNEAAEMPKLPKKMRGKRISQAEYDKIVFEYIKQQESMHRFPWGIRY